MKPVLFITLPNVALFMKKKKDALGVPYGASVLTAGIQAAGIELDYYDFNLALNRIRQEYMTPQETIQVLTNPEKFLAHYNKNTEKLLTSWVKALCSELENKNYHTICLSMDRREYSALSSKGSYGFALLMAKELKERFHAPVIMGGQYAFNSLGAPFLNQIRESISDFPVDIEARGVLIFELGNILVELQNGLSISDLDKSKRLEQIEPFNNSALIVPNYKIKNMADLLVERSEYLPDEVVSLLPQKYQFLRDLDPFFIAPFKFSKGCPFTCAFCVDGVSMKYTQHRAENVVEVLSKLAAQGICDFNFYNNNINLNRIYLEDFERLLRESNTKIRFSDSANLQKTGDEFFGVIARMGCIRLWYGTETVSERQLGYINKNLNLEKIVSGLASADKYGIWNSCNFIFNFPHETWEDFHNLMNFIESSPLVDTFETNEFRLLANSAFREQAEKFGLKLRFGSDNSDVYAFDEVGGATWEEKIQMGVEKRAIVRKLKTPIYRYLSFNDYLVFALRRAGLHKAQIKEVEGIYSDFLTQNSLRKRYADDHLHSLPSSVFQTRPIGTTIFGMDVTSRIAVSDDRGQASDVKHVGAAPI